MAINKKRIGRLLRGALILGLVTGIIYGLGWSNLIQVKKIEFSGTTKSQFIEAALTRERVSLKEGMPLARVDVRAVTRIAKEQGWILESKISRNWWSGKVSIAITEREPVAAYISSENSLTYFDAQGISFTSPVPYSIPGEANGLPSITFTNNSSDARRAAAEWVAAMPSEYLAIMSSVRVSSSLNIVMKSVDPALQNKPVTVMWGGVRDLPLKIKVLRALLARPENKSHHLFDLSTPLAPITR